MGMVVRSNMNAMNANRNLSMNNGQVAKSLEKLASGYQINRAGDDAAGLAISEKMKSQIKGLEQASNNSQDGVSLVQTAEGGMNEIHDMLNRMVELSTKSANGTINDQVDRDAIQSEINALSSEIDRIADATNFNGIKLLDGSMKEGASATTVVAESQTQVLHNGTQAHTGDMTGSAAKLSGVKVGDTVSINGSQFIVGMKDDGTVDSSAITEELGKWNASTTVVDKNTGETYLANVRNDTGENLDLQVGDTYTSFNMASVKIDSMKVDDLGISGLDVTSQESAGFSIDRINAAINKVSTNRANLGALQNRLEYTINNLDNTSENMTAANSAIRDTDMATEMMEYTKMNVLTQSAQSMLAQANQAPQQILSLLG